MGPKAPPSYSEDDNPAAEKLSINFVTAAGIQDFAAYRLRSKKRASDFLQRAYALVKDRKLFGVSGSLTGRLLQAKCRGSGEGDVYNVKVEFEATGGHDIDWAQPYCSCPHAAKGSALCKHSLALLLAHLDKTAWADAGGEAAPVNTIVSPAAAPLQPLPSVAVTAAAQARSTPSAPHPAASQAAAAPAGAAAPRKRRLPDLARPPKVATTTGAAKRARLEDGGPAPPPPQATQRGAARKRATRAQPALQGEAAGPSSKAQAAGPRSTVPERLKGERLLQDSDAELLRQCREALGAQVLPSRTRAKPLASRVPFPAPVPSQEAQCCQPQQPQPQRVHTQSSWLGTTDQRPSVATLQAVGQEPAPLQHEQQHPETIPDISQQQPALAAPSMPGLPTMFDLLFGDSSAKI